jgi:hypothetical protein
VHAAGERVGATGLDDDVDVVADDGEVDDAEVGVVFPPRG